MNRILILIAACLALSAASVQAQTLNAGVIKFTLDGTKVGLLSLPPWTLPAASGTLSLGGLVGWEVGGQNTGLIGKLGSTDAFDVQLIAGGASNVRMTLLNSAPAVLLPTQTQLRLGDAAGGEYIALVSPPTVKVSNITYVLPDSLPGGDDVRLKVNSIAGNTVTLGYTNPNTTGQIG